MFYRFRFFRRARALALTPDEKDAARREVLAFMEAYPVRASAEARPLGQRSNPPFSFLAPILKPIPLAALALLLIGTGTASAAEGALPDTPLYFVKVNINEPIRRSLALSAEAKAEVEADLATRRLDEAKALAEQDRLTPAVQAEIEARFKEQADRAEAKIRTVKETGDASAAADLSARYAAKLRVRQDALDRLSERPIDASAAITPVLDAVRLKTETATRQRQQLKVEAEAAAKVDEGTGREPSPKWKGIALAAQAEVADRFAELQQERAQAGAVVAAERLAKIDAQLAAAQEAAANGRASFEAGAYVEASEAFRASSEALREAKALLRETRKPDLEAPRKDGPTEKPKNEDPKPIIRPGRVLPVKPLPEMKQDPAPVAPISGFFKDELHDTDPDRSKAELDKNTP